MYFCITVIGQDFLKYLKGRTCNRRELGYNHYLLFSPRKNAFSSEAIKVTFAIFSEFIRKLIRVKITRKKNLKFTIVFIAVVHREMTFNYKFELVRLLIMISKT